MRQTSFVVGGYVVVKERVLLLWHSDLDRWVPAGGRIDMGVGEYPHEALEREIQEECGLAISGYTSRPVGINDRSVRALPCPVAAQEISLEGGGTYFDLVYYCQGDSRVVSLNYREARAYHWFDRAELESYPLLPHVRHHAHSAVGSFG